jgi:Arc/MetJ-type ribon-helix-helix transcriptional regulator
VARSVASEKGFQMELDDDVVDAINALVSSGRYPSAEAVIIEALTVLEQEKGRKAEPADPTGAIHE